MQTKIETLWASLEAEPASQTGLLYRRYSVSVKSDVFVGLRNRAGQRERLLAIRLTEAAPLPALALHDLRLELMTDPAQTNRQLLLLVLTNAAQTDLFGVVCEDLIGQIADFDTETDLLRTLTNRLGQWQALFESQSPGGLSAEARQGLFGELVFLHNWLAKSPGQSRCLSAWTGPTGSKHDFQAGETSVEIKTTSVVSPQTIRISNERQLDDTGLKHLFLWLMLLDIQPNSSSEFQTLNTLIDRLLRELIDHPTALNLFRLRLYEVGYRPGQRPLYDCPAYRVREDRVFGVSNGFPRLRESDLPPGVGAVQYGINVALCEPFRVAGDTVFSYLNA